MMMMMMMMMTTMIMMMIMVVMMTIHRTIKEIDRNCHHGFMMMTFVVFISVSE